MLSLLGKLVCADPCFSAGAFHLEFNAAGARPAPVQEHPSAHLVTGARGSADTGSAALAAGVPATQVAEWAGHSVHVLLKVYASCIDGQDEAARKRIEDALGDPSRATLPRQTGSA